MKDKNGNELRIGEIVKIVGDHSVPIRNYFIIKGFIQHPTVTEAVLLHYVDNTVEFVPLSEIEKPFS